MANLVTDIFGNNVRSNVDKLPFIIVNSANPRNILQRATAGGIDSIWRPICSTVSQILSMSGINPDDFAFLGDIWFPNSNLPDKASILMVNITGFNISAHPLDYTKIDTYEDLSIWKPICPKGFREVGLMASPIKPATSSGRVLRNDVITEYNGDFNSVGRNTRMNEFNLLANTSQRRYTIDRTKFLHNEYDVNIQSKYDGRYITNDVTDNNEILLQQGNYFPKKMSYSSQGELRMNGLCIGTSQDSRNNVIGDTFVYLQPCDGNEGQRWYPYKDAYISQDDQQCLTNADGVLSKESCDGSMKQKWATADYNTVIENIEQQSTHNWTTQKGDRVVLIEPDNPWYITKNKKVPEGIVNQGIKQLNNVEYKDAADYNSNFMMNVYRPDMGYGYSLEQRLGKACDCIENCNKIDQNSPMFEPFEGKKKRKSYLDFNLIACCLLFLIFLLVVIRFCLNTYRS